MPHLAPEALISTSEKRKKVPVSTTVRYENEQPGHESRRVAAAQIAVFILTSLPYTEQKAHR